MDKLGIANSLNNNFANISENMQVNSTYSNCTFCSPVCNSVEPSQRQNFLFEPISGHELLKTIGETKNSNSSLVDAISNLVLKNIAYWRIFSIKAFFSGIFPNALKCADIVF